MNTLFTLGDSRMGADCLLIEIGSDYCCYAYLDNPKKSIELIRYFQFNEVEATTVLDSIIKNIDHDFSRILICSSSANALLVPTQFFNNEISLPGIVYDIPSYRHLNDELTEFQMHTVHALPLSLYEMLVHRFPSASFCHSYTPALKIYNGFVAPSQVDVHFTTSHFRVIVKRESNLQLAQTYSYTSPLDVVYYLLKIFSEFNLNQSDTLVIISGLVDKDSALYQELHHYFVNLHFAHPPGYSIPGDDHPPYYFTSIYNLAACVS